MQHRQTTCCGRIQVVDIHECTDATLDAQSATTSTEVPPGGVVVPVMFVRPAASVPSLPGKWWGPGATGCIEVDGIQQQLICGWTHGQYSSGGLTASLIIVSRKGMSLERTQEWRRCGRSWSGRALPLDGGVFGVYRCYRRSWVSPRPVGRLPTCPPATVGSFMSGRCSQHTSRSTLQLLINTP